MFNKYFGWANSNKTFTCVCIGTINLQFYACFVNHVDFVNLQSWNRVLKTVHQVHKFTFTVSSAERNIEKKSIGMKLAVILSLVLALAIKEVCSGNGIILKKGLHSQRVYVPAKGKEVREYKVNYPSSVSWRTSRKI